MGVRTGTEEGRGIGKRGRRKEGEEETGSRGKMKRGKGRERR